MISLFKLEVCHLDFYFSKKFNYILIFEKQYFLKKKY